MKLTKRLWLAIILILVVVAVPVSTPVVAGPSQTHEDKVDLLKELWGEDMSMGEVLEQVLPEVLEDRSNEELELLYTFKMIWPDPSEKYPPSSETRATGEGRRFIIVVVHDCDMSADWPWIDFSSSSRVYLPHPWYRLPYMAAWSYLWYYPNSLKDFAFDDGYNVYEVSAEGTYQTSTAGYYRVTGTFYGQYPPGYEPPTYYATDATDWEYVSP